MILVILMGIVIPIIFGLLHTIVGTYLIYSKGNMTALSWNMLGFLTKSVFMLFMTYMGVSVLEFDFRNLDPDKKPNTRICKEVRTKGSLVVFPSFVWHRVKPVTKGSRYSLVIWSLGWPFK